MDFLNTVLSTVNGVFWGVPGLVFLVAIGLYLSISVKFLPFRRLGFIFKKTFGSIGKDSSSESLGTISRFGAVCASLATTVGMGNIVGVASAICLGGPGAVFWMIVAAFLGSIMKYFEVALAIIYREKNLEGEYFGGPSLYMSKGMKAPWLGVAITVLISIACLCGNMIQSNVFLANFHSVIPLKIPMAIQALVLALAIGWIVLGGIVRLGKVSEILVPLMSIVYIGFGLVVIFVNYERIPAMVGLVFKGAFTPVAIAGGVLGYGFKASIRYGIARGFFSNGGGQGIFSIAHASAKVENPIDQAIWAIEEIFVDCTICLISAITIITSGIALDPASAATIVNKAFSQTFGFMGYIVAFSVLMFTFTTVAGFCYMGEAQLSQLMKPKYAKIYRYVFIVLCYVGAMSELTAIWNFTDALAGLIMFINLIVLVVLSPQVRRLTSEYFAKPAAGAASKTR